MKNFKLLLATTAILSAGAIVANADGLNSNQAVLEMRANIVKPIIAIPEAYLGFGMILGDEGGKYVVVTPNGDLGPAPEGGTLATMFGTATYSNYAYNEDGEVINRTTGSVNQGKIRYKNMLNDSAFGVAGTTPDETTVNAAYTLNFADDSVPLTDSVSGATCGTVSGFTKYFTIEENDVIANIGGTFRTANMSAAANTGICSGTTTVTILVDNTKYAAGSEAWIDSIEAAAAGD